MKIERLEIHAGEIPTHGYAFWATAHCVGTFHAGLTRGGEIQNWLEVTVSHHYGLRTAGHAVTMLLKKCRRMSGKLTEEVEVRWKCNEGTDDLVSPIRFTSGDVDETRMNAIISSLAKRHGLKAVLPYPG